MKEVVIGFDLSTTVLGFCICDNKTKEIIELNYYKFKKDTELIEKAFELEIFIDNLLNLYLIRSIIIEERLKAFQTGKSNAESILKLAAFNFYCQWIFAKRNIIVKQLNVMTARKLAFVSFHSVVRKLPIKQKQKEYAFALTLKELGEDVFPTKIIKSGKNKGKKAFLDEAKDMSDAWILTKAYFAIKQ